ncbi:hypothetical protein WA026_014705 [Henosepilachna vigintioctopunctata]|uniref:Uncharacterized protein n=1 Tax=Henosepilachna vigintioctopunctata TaxID=420089 RepID=A0AAW1V8I7_9CUCU
MMASSFVSGRDNFDEHIPGFVTRFSVAWENRTYTSTACSRNISIMSGAPWGIRGRRLVISYFSKETDRNLIFGLPAQFFRGLRAYDDVSFCQLEILVDGGRRDLS